MKDLKAFIKKLREDKPLAKKVSNADTVDEVVSIAADAGYSFTADEFMNEQMSAVSGGEGGSAQGGGIDVQTGDFLNFDFSKINAKIQQEISGSRNTGQNTGNVSVSKWESNMWILGSWCMRWKV